MSNIVDAKMDPRFGNWGIRIKDHKEELYNSINNENSLSIGRDTEFSTTVAELIIGLMIVSMRGLDNFIINQKNKIWDHKQYRTVHRKRIGIIGNGAIGGKVKEFISIFYPLSEVYAFSKHGQFESFTMDKFDDLLPKLDIVIIAVPETEETFNLFNADRIKKMKNEALLINVSKATTIDQEELVKHLYDKRIFAAVDQTDPVKLPENHPLWNAPNFIMTPHIGVNAK